MSEIIELIKILRERTGAGLMDCKHALTECDMDIEKSVDWLREKGIAKQAKKSNRIAAEGLTTVKINGNKVVVLEINCETDFVAKADPFIKLVDDVAAICLEQNPADVEALKLLSATDGTTVNELFVNAGLKLGEKLSLRRFKLIEKGDGEIFGSYVHGGGTIASLVRVKSNDANFAEQLAMSIAANAPIYLSSKDIPAEEIEKETKLQNETAKDEENFDKKPADIQEKIITGRVKKHFVDSVLLEQEFVVNPDLTVEKACEQNKAEIIEFVRYQVGEGIEKRKDDFAAEVAKEMK
jgi:elongation factor Ts